MFGFYRTMLALWVMAYHLLDIPIIGTYAVFSFFVLSGFLMTTIMHESYGYTFAGAIRYAENRFLRLYPMYWVTALFSIAIIEFASTNYSIRYNDALFVPHSLHSLIYNIFMIFPGAIPWTVVPRLSPPTWALTVEIFFYLCIGFGLSKNKTITISWLLVTVVYYAYSYIVGFDEDYRYAFVFGASLPFSLGAMLYFYKHPIYNFLLERKLSSPVIWLALYCANAAFFALCEHLFHEKYLLVTETGKYLNLALTMMTVLTLNFSKEFEIDRKIDSKIGDYSYPIYLIHWQAGLLASKLLFSSPTRGHDAHGVISFAVALFVTLVYCWALIFLIDVNVNAIRDKIRNNSRNGEFRLQN